MLLLSAVPPAAAEAAAPVSPYLCNATQGLFRAIGRTGESLCEGEWLGAIRLMRQPQLDHAAAQGTRFDAADAAAAVSL